MNRSTGLHAALEAIWWRRINRYLRSSRGTGTPFQLPDKFGSFSYKIPLHYTTACGNSKQWWFTCPGCFHRRRILYLLRDSDELSCRVCLDLRYPSEFFRGSSDVEQLWRNAVPDQEIWRRSEDRIGRCRRRVSASVLPLQIVSCACLRFRCSQDKTSAQLAASEVICDGELVRSQNSILIVDSACQAAK
jgi:hypothetical protein